MRILFSGQKVVYIRPWDASQLCNKFRQYGLSRAKLADRLIDLGIPYRLEITYLFEIFYFHFYGYTYKVGPFHLIADLVEEFILVGLEMQ